MKTIPQRVLRNQIGRVLRDVGAGEPVRITVAGRAVADLVPVGGERRTFVPGDEVDRLLAQAPLDPAFGCHLEAAGGATIDEL